MMRNSSSKESVFSRLDAVMLIAARHAEGVCFVIVIDFLADLLTLWVFACLVFFVVWVLGVGTQRLSK